MYDDDFDPYVHNDDCDERFEGLSMNQIESLLEDEATAKALQDEAISSWAY